MIFDRKEAFDMVKKGESLRVQENVQMRGGDGTIILQHFLNADEMHGKGRLFSRITVKPGCSIGYHEHHGESEIFAVLSGTGRFNDNGTDVSVSAGDVLVTGSGNGHGIACVGEEPLELVALILFDESTGGVK